MNNTGRSMPMYSVQWSYTLSISYPLPNKTGNHTTNLPCTPEHG